jgi:phosphoglycolate phosphatase
LGGRRVADIRSRRKNPLFPLPISRPGDAFGAFIYVLSRQSPLIIPSGLFKKGLKNRIGYTDRRGERMSGSNREMPKVVKAVVFDLDDTLVLSTVDYAKFKRLVIERIASHGEDPSAYSPTETIVAIVSRYEARMRRYGMAEAEIKRRVAELDRIMDDVELEKVGDTRVVDGAIRLLEMLRAHGVKIGVLTRGCHSYAETALRTTGLLDLVDELECRNSATPAKPNPASYLRLVDRLGVPKDQTLFVGDHPIDAQCAKNADVPFIAVETGDVPEGDLRAAGCVEVFRDVGQLVDWFSKILQE